MEKLTIIHYLPVSYYPPVMNFINVVADKMSVEVITKRPVKGEFFYRSDKANIISLNFNGRNSVLNFWATIWYVIYSIFRLILTCPDKILYYESNSALPAYIYKRFFRKKTAVYAHYHEYFTEDDYCRPGMKVSLFNHGLERKWLYTHSTWVSQTCSRRMELFLAENPMVPLEISHIFPNYPPKRWWKKHKEHAGEICKCVYIGSLSLESTYVEEFCRWVANQRGKVIFDIYSYNFHEDILKMLSDLSSDYICFHKEGIQYSNIPTLLDSYDVGLILYKPRTMNMKWNETNKFYEYLICGLDVWYPKEMLQLHLMDKSLYAPEVKELDFSNLNDFSGSVSPRVVDNRNYSWFAEDVYRQFISE